MGRGYSPCCPTGFFWGEVYYILCHDVSTEKVNAVFLDDRAGAIVPLTSPPAYRPPLSINGEGARWGYVGWVGPFSPSSRLWRQLGATRHNPYGVQLLTPATAGIYGRRAKWRIFLGINTKQNTFLCLAGCRYKEASSNVRGGLPYVRSHHMSSAADAVGAPAKHKNKKKPAIIYSPT